MTCRPRLLDLFCGAGGASVGYHRSGFDVVGVDIAQQPNYPFEFVRADALAVDLDGFDLIHASPPCQASSSLTKGNRARGWKDDHVDLIPEVRARLDAHGAPYVIENVPGSGLRRDLILCGLMFDLRVFRHRYFELGGWSTPGRACFGGRSHAGYRLTRYRGGVKHVGNMMAVYGSGGGKGSVVEWQDAMGINWTTDRRELAEAIPPAYAEHVGSQWLLRGGRQ